jgi:hypothetical protein
MDEVQLLKNENEFLKNKVIELEEKLKKYTAPARNKKYYENNKEIILEKQKEYVVTTEKKKEYARRAYLKMKEKNNIL